MLYVVAFVVAAGLGFVGSRLLRSPANAAQAASVARGVSGTLGARRGLDAPELQRACFSEMVRHVRVNRQGRTHAPARYRLRLNPGDLAVVNESRRWFTDGLTAALRDAAAQHGWTLDGEIDIGYEADPARRPGAPVAVPLGRESAAARAAVSAGDRRTGGREGRRARGLALVRGDTGERVELGSQPVTIGRSPDNTISSADERISRSHARVEPAGSGWVLVDLGSANGTRVDDRRVEPGTVVPLTAGAVVSAGPLDLRVVPVDRPAEGDVSGTRALDDADRTRISTEVLGHVSRGRPR